MIYACSNCAKIFIYFYFHLIFKLGTSPGDDGAGLLLKLSVDGSLVMRTFSEGRRLNLKSNTEEQLAAHTYIRGEKEKASNMYRDIYIYYI